MTEMVKRIGARTGGLLLLVGAFAALTLMFTSDTVLVWIGRVSVAAVLAATGWWASRDAHFADLDTGLRDWLLVSFLVGVGWWVAQTLLEGEHEVIDRLGLDFAAVLTTIGLVFAAALVGAIVGRGQARADERSSEL